MTTDTQSAAREAPSTASERVYDLDLDPRDVPLRERYKLVCGLIVPRPIALVTSQSPTGIVNAAPFSFFNIFSEEPAVIALGLNSKPDGSIKDTTRNLRETGEFVVHVVTEGIAEKANICSTEFPSDMSEIDIAEFAVEPSRVVAPPTISEAPVALECRLMAITPLSPVRNLALGEIVWIRTRGGVVDPERFYVDIERYRPVARLFGNLYAKLGGLFELKRLTWPEWQAAEAEKRASAEPGERP